jgi:peptidoglycan/LPS O-acetylase OafA/YrhL
VLFALFVLVALLYRDTRVTALLRSRFLCFWGSIAYGFYMYHQGVAGLLHGWLRDGAAPALIDSRAIGVTLLALVVSILLAWASFRTMERFFLNLGKRYRFGPDPAPVASGEDSMARE